MLQTYTLNNNGVTLNTGDAVPFNINLVNTRCKVTHVAGTPTIEINQRGYYQITFTSFGYNTGAVVEGTDYSGMYAFQLNNKGVPIVNAVTAESSTSDTEVSNVMFSTILYVPPSCKIVDNNMSLTVNYLGQVGTLLAANLSVVKIG